MFIGVVDERLHCTLGQFQIIRVYGFDGFFHCIGNKPFLLCVVQLLVFRVLDSLSSGLKFGFLVFLLFHFRGPPFNARLKIGTEILVFDKRVEVQIIIVLLLFFGASFGGHVSVVH